MRLNRRAFIASFFAGTILATAPAHAFIDGKATLNLQVLQQAQLVEQVANQVKQLEQGLAMLKGLGVNTSADVFAQGGALQNVLRQADSIIARHSEITGYLGELYPQDIDRNTTAGALAELARRQHEEGRKRQLDAARIQAEVFRAMEDARTRDRSLMDKSAGAPGVTAAVQATNQLVGGLNSDVRALQLATIAHQRTVEDRFMREDADAARVMAQVCKNSERTPESAPSYCGFAK